MLLTLPPSGVASSQPLAGYGGESRASSYPHIEVVAAGFTPSPEGLGDLASGMPKGNDPELIISSPAQEWTGENQRLFKKLSFLEAVDDISSEQRFQLERLSALRRKFIQPRTGVEMLHEYRMSQRVDSLVSALSEFFKFRRFYAESSANKGKKKIF
jgi:hypothetical protein